MRFQQRTLLFLPATFQGNYFVLRSFLALAASPATRAGWARRRRHGLFQHPKECVQAQCQIPAQRQNFSAALRRNSAEFFYLSDLLSKKKAVELWRSAALKLGFDVELGGTPRVLGEAVPMYDAAPRGVPVKPR